MTILKIAEEYGRLAHRALTQMPEERVPIGDSEPA
jgi:hypothetical protein